MATLFRRAAKKIACRYMFCEKDVTEKASVEVHQLVGTNYAERTSEETVYFCKMHMDWLERMSFLHFEFWLSQEGWFYIVNPDEGLNQPLPDGVQKGPGWG